MCPGVIEGANLILHKPDDMTDEECSSLHVLVEGDAMISAWHPTPEELKALNAGQPVYLYIYGSAHPPVAIGVKAL